jgi:hypothetical protein
MVGLAGVEPATYALGVRRSIHVSYSPVLRFYQKFSCAHLVPKPVPFCPNYPK